MSATDDKDKRRLRLIPSPDEKPAVRPDPKLKPLLDDLKRRYSVMHERLKSDGDTPEAA
ncbi:MAG: hypothetical protein H0W99_05905 [Acidobacteria bacterium]|nr:hypothetical protein [Acidobacteriota bacterium]